jgi:hypothetical protein
MKFVLPPGSGSRSVWGLGRHAWGSVHFWIAATLLVVMVVHVGLHWAWVCAATRRVALRSPSHARLRGPRDALWGAVFLTAIVVVLGGFVLAARGGLASSGGTGGNGGAESGVEVGAPLQGEARPASPSR